MDSTSLPPASHRKAGVLLFISCLVGSIPLASVGAPRQTAGEWLEYVMIEESPDAVRERFRAEGIPTGFRELLGERPPDEGNGWIFLSEWIKRSEALIAENAESADRILSGMSESDDGDDWEASAAGFLAEASVRESIETLRAILESPGWYPVREWEDGFELVIPEIGSMRKLGLILSVAQRYSLMRPEQSRWTSGELLVLQMQLARKSASEPCLISYLTGIALMRMVQEDVRWYYGESSEIPLSPRFDRRVWIDYLSSIDSGSRAGKRGEVLGENGHCVRRMAGGVRDRAIPVGKFPVSPKFGPTRFGKERFRSVSLFACERSRFLRSAAARSGSGRGRTSRGFESAGLVFAESAHRGGAPNGRGGVILSWGAARAAAGIGGQAQHLYTSFPGFF